MLGTEMPPERISQQQDQCSSDIDEASRKKKKNGI